jgi:hypothetical protein
MARVEIGSLAWGHLQDPLGNASQATATIKDLVGANATHYSAITAGTSSTASLVGDANGMLTLSSATRYIEEGSYTLDVPALGIAAQRVEAVAGDHDYDKDNGQAGLYGPTVRGWYQTGVVMTNTIYRYHRVVPSRVMPIIKLGHVVSTAALSNDSVDFGLYTAAGVKIVSTGLTAGKCNALGPQSITIATTTLQPGVTYYYAHKYGTIGSTAASVMCSVFTSIYAVRAFGTTAGLLEAGDGSAAAGDPLPATLAFGTATAANYPNGLLLEV